MKYEVIIPVYNGEDVIASCLESITSQEGAVLGQDYSVLVVDDGSSDATTRIASRFPVRVISLGENRGRIVARLTGAREATAERLFFMDSRVQVPKNLIAGLARFDSHPAVQGVDEASGKTDKSPFGRVFYLVRRKVYGKENFPVQKNDMIITRRNFKRAPKGTTILLIDRKLFLDLTPEKTGKDVNDDTRLFQKLVFEKGIEILRTTKMRFRYNPQRSLGQSLKWLYERGVRFADFYFTPGGYLHTHFKLVAAALAVSILLAMLLLFLAPQNLPIVFWPVLACHLGLCVYLSEELLDFPILLVTLPAILFVFGAGVLRYWIKKAIDSLSRQRGAAEPR